MLLVSHKGKLILINQMKNLGQYQKISKYKPPDLTIIKHQFCDILVKNSKY